ncbi:unnamed protein product, partial [Ectocarpus sp. 12 AP-2014]
MSGRQLQYEELSRLLQQLGDTWVAEWSAAEVPKALSDLLYKIKTSTSPTAPKGPTHDSEDVD